MKLLIGTLMGLLLAGTLLSSCLGIGWRQMGSGSTESCLTEEGSTPSASRQPCVKALAIASAASLIASHIHGNPGVWYDSQMPEEALTHWQQRCPVGSSCWPYWQNGNLQCVQLVSAAFALIGEPLPAIGNAIDFWGLYAARPGWSRIEAGGGSAAHLPFPGDIMVWDNGGLGHVAIVTNVVPPKTGTNGSVTFAQANGPGSLISHPLLPDYSVKTWQGYQVLGYIRSEQALASMARGALEQPKATPLATIPASMTSEFYVELAGEEAKKNQLPPDLFVKQIAVESAFNPAAISPAGAIGIAQFMPATAGELGIDPYDPVASLEAAAALMASYVKAYGGDYAKALAAYHAGPGAVAGASEQCGDAWLSCLTTDTRHYVTLILSSPLPSQSGLDESFSLHSEERRASCLCLS